MSRVVRGSLWLLGAGVGLVFLKQMLGHYGTGGSRFGQEWSHPTPLPAALAIARQRQMADSLTIELHARSDRSDSVFVADITVANHSASPVSAVALTCDALGDNGATTGHAMATLHDLFAPHEIKTETNVQLRFIHQPASARCTVAGVTIAP